MRGRPVPYSAAELAFVQARAAHETRAAIRTAFVETFGRPEITVDQIKALCTRYGWRTPRETWTAEDDAQLRTLYPHQSTKRVAAALGRALQACYRRALLLGMHKDPAYLASEESGRLRPGSDLGKRTRWTPGHAPKNPKRGRGYCRGRMAETQFPKGKPSWNTVPVGTERVKDGYRWIKVATQPNVSWHHNWRQLHLVRWEAEHGPLPTAHCLKCLDGNRLNTEPANWTCVPRGVLARLNKGNGRKRIAYDEAPTELKPTVLALARLEHAMHERKEAA